MDAHHWYAFVNLNNWTIGETFPEILFVPWADVLANIERENKPDAKRLFYCPSIADAENYKNKTGIAKLLEVLQS